MIRGIHYFSTELKTKIDVIPRGCFNEESICNLANILDNIGTSNANPQDIQLQIDNALGSLCECLQSAADKTFKPYAQHKIHDKPLLNTKPWFDEEFHSKRRFYNKSKKGS